MGTQWNASLHSRYGFQAPQPFDALLLLEGQFPPPVFLAELFGVPRPPFSEEDTESLAGRVYDFVWQRTTAGALFTAAA